MYEFDFPFFPEQASTIAGITDLFTFSVIVLGGVIGIIVVLVTIYFLTVYSHDSEADRSNPVEEHTVIELTWSIAPLIVVLTLFVWSAKIYFDIHTPPPNTLNISVIGKQWMWKAQHPDGQREVNELHVPVNQPVRLTMTSQDVIHSFFIPAFRLKQDVVPGRFTTMWFEATQTGEFHLLCAEFCGTEHALMVGKVVVMEPSEYEKWLREGNPPVIAASNSQSGEALFVQQGCVSCHKLDDSVGIGPSLVGLYEAEVELENGEAIIRDEEYLRESIINPQAKIVAGYPAVMPTYQGQLSEEQLLELVDYLRNLEQSSESASAEISTSGQIVQLR